MAVEQFMVADLLGPLSETEERYAPETLFVSGNKDLLAERGRVAVIGTRHVSDAGLRRTLKLVDRLVEHDVVVVSGLARGVDTAAHRRAIERGGSTIAVLGTPLNKTYPRENRELQDQIMREHLAVSQFPPGHAGGRWCFPQRNRTMALIADATVIVEAGDGSGTLSQGWETLRLKHPLFIMKSTVANTALEWPEAMLTHGARVLTDSNLDELLERIPRRSPGADARFAF